MSKSLEVQELAIVIAAKDYDPTLLNPGFLKYSGIIPTEWQLARQPVVNNRIAQIIFQNGVNLVAQPERIMFVEALKQTAEPIANIPDIVRRYVDSLPRLDYQAIGINFRSYLQFENQPEAPNQYLLNNILAPSPWQKLGTDSVKASLNLLFTFDDKRLNLIINEAVLQFSEEKQVPIVLFNGNFDYDLSSYLPSERTEKIQTLVQTWQTDLEKYTETVSKFLGDKEETFILPILTEAVA